MLNIRRIIWAYDNFGLAGAIRMACYDVEAMLLYILYALTLPVQFVILWKKFYYMRMRRQYDKSND